MNELIHSKAPSPQILEQTVQNLKKIKEEVSLAFQEKRLLKGFTEVVTAIDKRENISSIYVVGLLDEHYHKSLQECLSKTGALESGKTNFYKLNSLKNRSLVYECIKDLEVPGTKKYNYKALIDKISAATAVEGKSTASDSSKAISFRKIQGIGRVPKRYLKKTYESRKFFLCRVFAIKEKENSL